MRKLSVLILIGLMFIGCKEEPYQFREGEYVWFNCYNDVVKPKADGRKYKNYGGLYENMPMHDIVRSETKIYLNLTFDYGGKGVRWFWDELIDTVNDRLQFKAEDILMLDGSIEDDFIRSHDLFITMGDAPNAYSSTPTLAKNADCDTIGYIPNAVIRAAERAIDSLYALEKYDEIYELFHTAFELRRCTGEEYKEIVLRGEN